MRIIGGQLSGLILKAPATRATRPMTDKVRGALFDALGDIEGLTLLDAYAGSGAVGFEALSRGASSVVGIEAGRNATEAIRQNQSKLGLDWGYRLYPVTVESWLAHQQTEQFNLIVADPPYDQLKEDVLEKLAQHLQDDGLLIVSHASKQAPELAGMRVIRAKDYGDSALTFYQAT